MPTPTLADVLTTLAADDPAVAAAIVAGDAEAVARACNAPRADTLVPRTRISADELLGVSDEVLDTLTATQMRRLNLALAAGGLDPRLAANAALCAALGLPVTRPGSRCEAAGLPPASYTAVALVLWPPTLTPADVPDVPALPDATSEAA